MTWNKGTSEESSPSGGGLLDQLKKPIVFVPLFLLVAIPTVLLIVWPDSRASKKRIVIVIHSDPSNAVVTINGKKLKRPTTARVSVLPGAYKIHVKLDGHDVQEKTLVVKADQSEQKVDFVLNKIVANSKTKIPKKTYRVTIQTNPKSADVFLYQKDILIGQEKSPATFTLTAGTYKAKAVSKGFYPLTKVLTVQSGVENQQLTMPLQREALGFQLLTVRTDPPNAVVTIVDKNKKAQSPQAKGIYKLPIGLYTVTVEQKYFATKTIKNMEITAKDVPAPLDVTLTRELWPLVVKSLPQKATVYIDNLKQSQFTDSTFMVKSGLHHIKVTYKGRSVFGNVNVAHDPKKKDEFIAEIPAKKFALLVAVHHYKMQLPDFLHAEGDIMKAARVLKAGGFDAENVTVLSQSLGEKDARLQPTSSNILTALHELGTRCQPQDQVLIAMIGHQTTKPGNKNSDLYFAPSNAKWNSPATFLPMTKVYAALQNCAATTKILILDAWRHFAGDPVPFVGETKEPRPNEIAVPKGISIFVGCPSHGVGFIHPHDRHGMLFYFLSKGLIGFADEDQDDKVTWKELIHYTSTSVKKASFDAYAAKVIPEWIGAKSGFEKVVVQTAAFADYRKALSLVAKNQDFGEARTLMDKAISANKLFVEMYLDRVDVLFRLSDMKKNYFNEAVADCRKALELEPFNAKANSMLGYLHGRFREYDKAKTFFDQAIKFEPQFSVDFYFRGLNFRLQKQLVNAVKDFSRAIALDRNLVKVYEARGFVYMEIGKEKYPLAIEDFSHVLAVDEKNYRALNSRGFLYAALKEYKMAAADYERAVKINSRSEKARFNLGNMYRFLRKYKLAIPQLEKAIELAPKWDPRPYKLLIEVFIADGQPNEAMRIRKLAEKNGIDIK